MKRGCWVSMVFLTFACDADAVMPDVIAYAMPDGVLELQDDGKIIGRCKINKPYEKIDPFFNWNHSVILLDDVNFVTTEDVISCTGGAITPSHIPRHAGFIVDVNVQAGIYLSLDYLYYPPMRYVALVAKLGTTTPLGSFPGMWSESKTLTQMQEEGGLGYNADMLPRISPDGRYVSADGYMICGAHRFPGVWDIKTNTLVVDQLDCASLFRVKRTP